MRSVVRLEHRERVARKLNQQLLVIHVDNAGLHADAALSRLHGERKRADADDARRSDDAALERGLCEVLAGLAENPVEPTCPVGGVEEILTEKHAQSANDTLPGRLFAFGEVLAAESGQSYLFLGACLMSAAGFGQRKSECFRG